MYTFLLTSCGLIALFGFMAIIVTGIFDRVVCIEDEEGIDYGKE